MVVAQERTAHTTSALIVVKVFLSICLKMWVLSCASPAYPTRSLRASRPIATVRSSSRGSVSFSTHRHHYQDPAFVPEVKLRTSHSCFLQKPRTLISLMLCLVGEEAWEALETEL
jgi:hypothetical protein